MIRIIETRHLFLEGERPLGAFVHYEDAKGRPAVKFSIKHKIGGGDMWVQERTTKKVRSFLPPDTEGASADASYKFQDRLVELKSEVPGQRPWRLMTEFPLPHETYLFAARMRDWKHLPAGTMGADGLLLAPPWPCDEIVIFASFAGAEGKPFMPTELMKPIEGRTIILPLPYAAPFDRLWIGIGEDIGNNEMYDLTISAPNYRKLK